VKNEPQHDHGDEHECSFGLYYGNEFIGNVLNMLAEIDYRSGTSVPTSQVELEVD